MEIQASDAITKPLSLYALIAALTIVFLTGRVLHQLFFDPLRHIPGPKINALSRIPHTRHVLAGTTVDHVAKLHEKYGPVVRISPNEVSFTSGETAWPDIYGFRTGPRKGRPNLPKDPVWYPPPVNGAKSILVSDDEAHSRGRRILAHAFSEKALAEQEPLLQNYVDQLVDGLREATSKEPVQDLTKWYNWITFDIVADLFFGEPFGCLQDRETHKYVKLLFDSLQAISLAYVVGYFPFVKYLGSLLFDSSLMPKRKEYQDWISSQVTKRIERETQRPDFMTQIMAHNGEKGTEMTKAQLDSNALLILTAGSETTATLLDGATYLLCKNPEKLAKLQQEVRQWKSYSDITLAQVNNSPYLLAVLNESLRFYPPVPVGFERRAQHDGEVISGVYIPKGTAVSVSQWPTNHSEANFRDCDSFVPERWLGAEEYADDKRAAMQPFSFGPRNCLGKNLAYAEMRLILAKMVWSFDMKLEEESADWIAKCTVKVLWVKPKLAIRLTPVLRE